MILQLHLISEIISLAEFLKNKAGVKLHVKLDPSGYVPRFVSMTEAKTHENNAIKTIPFEKDDILVFDKGYTDYEQYSNYCREGIYVVTRIKVNDKYEVVKSQDVENNSSSNKSYVLVATDDCPDL